MGISDGWNFKGYLVGVNFPGIIFALRLRGKRHRRLRRKMAEMQERLSRREKARTALQKESWETAKNSQAQPRDGPFAVARERLERLSWKSYMRLKKLL